MSKTTESESGWDSNVNEAPKTVESAPEDKPVFSDVPVKNDERRRDFNDERRRDFGGERRRDFNDDRRRDYGGDRFSERRRDFNDERSGDRRRDISEDRFIDRRRDFNDDRRRDYGDDRRRDFNDDRRRDYGDDRRRDFNDDRRRDYGDDRRRDYGYDYPKRQRRLREDPSEPNEVIGIFNLSYNLTPRDFDEALAEKLAEFKGKFTNKLVMNRLTERCKGYGFVQFDSIEDSIKAKSILENGEIHGQKYTVAYSIQRRPVYGDSQAPSTTDGANSENNKE